MTFFPKRPKNDWQPPGVVLPTRHGNPQGGAAERQLMQKAGVDGYRKQYQINMDGSTTRLTTKDGHPQFLTEGNKKTDAPTVPVYPYLETGQLEWTFPGAENPTRGNPATWHFTDIGTSNLYLGYIVPKTGVQHNFPPLLEGQESQAIGYKKVVLSATSTPEQIAASVTTNAARKTAAMSNIIIKKTIAGFFPPSLFSGKMRLFMQAQYGAMAKDFENLRIEFVGESMLLRYHYGETSVQFGLWAHNSPGIYTASDGTFWLITVTSPTSGLFVFTRYPIVPDASVKEVVAKRKITPGESAETKMMDAYIFANCVIDTSKPSVIGSLAGSGGALCYGWKWKADGSQAKIVIHSESGSGATAKFSAKTVTANFIYSDGVLTMSGETIVHGDWMDGWGTHNTFVPIDPVTSGGLQLFTITDGFPRPDFNFGDTPVYGYYKDDVWTTAKISRSSTPVNIYEQSNTDMFYTPSSESATNNYQYSHNLSNVGVHYSSRSATASVTMNLTVGENLYKGTVEYGTHYSIDMDYSGPRTTEDNAVSFIPNVISDATSGYHGLPPGYSTFNANNEGANHGGFIEWVVATRVRKSFTGEKYYAWALVIPTGDCDAVYVATRISDGEGTYTTTTSTAKSIVRFFSSISSYVPFIESSHFGWWYGFSATISETTVTTPAPTIQEKLYAHNAANVGTPVTPGGSLTALFEVDFNYPYYDRGMYTYTSYGKRYAMSENLKSPDSVNAQHRFVGWA